MAHWFAGGIDAVVTGNTGRAGRQGAVIEGAGAGGSRQGQPGVDPMTDIAFLGGGNVTRGLGVARAAGAKNFRMVQRDQGLPVAG